MSGVHNILGPSSTERSVNCPGWVQLAKTAPPELPSIYAAEGTCAHHLAAIYLEACLKGDPISGYPEIGKSYAVHKETGEVTELTPALFKPSDFFVFKVTQEMVDAISVYVDYCIEASAAAHPYHRYVETRLPIPSEIAETRPEAQLGGTTDFSYFVTFSHIEVVDFKYGSGVVVSPYKNMQGLSYALGEWFKMDESDRKYIEFIRITIVQPRGFGNGVQSWDCTPEEMLAFYHDQLLPTQKAIFVDESKVVNAGDWCKFCPAELVCPIKEKARKDLLAITLDDLEGKPDLPSVVKDDIPRLVAIIEEGKIVTNLIEKAKKRLEELTDAKVDTGYQFEPTYSNYKWTDEKEAAKALEQFTKEPLHVLISPAKMVDAIYKTSKEMKEKRTKKECEELVREFNYQEVTGRKLVKKVTEDVDLLDSLRDAINA